MAASQQRDKGCKPPTVKHFQDEQGQMAICSKSIAITVTTLIAPLAAPPIALWEVYLPFALSLGSAPENPLQMYDLGTQQPSGHAPLKPSVLIRTGA